MATESEQLLSIVRTLADVPRQNETILRQMQEDRAAVHGQLTGLSEGLAVHVAQCSVRHAGLDQRISGCENSIETLFDRSVEAHKCEKADLVQRVYEAEARVSQAEAREKEEVTHNIEVITEQKTYRTRTAIGAAISIVVAVFGAGGLATYLFHVVFHLW